MKEQEGEQEGCSDVNDGGCQNKFIQKLCIRMRRDRGQVSQEKSSAFGSPSSHDSGGACVKEELCPHETEARMDPVEMRRLSEVQCGPQGMRGGVMVS